MVTDDVKNINHMYKFKKVNLFIFFVIASAFFVAVLQPFGLSLDYANYQYFFQQIRLNFSGELKDNRFEPGFKYVAGIVVKLLTSDILVYGFFAVVSIAIKLIYLRRFTYARNFFYIACIFYMFKFFPLLELTQLRGSIAIAILLVAYYYIQNGKKIYGAGIGILAILFHYSTLMLLPFLFLPKLSRKMSIIIAVFIFSALYLTSQYGIGFASKNLLAFQGYESNGYGENVLKKFSPVYFPEFFILAFSIFHWRYLTDGMRRIVSIELIGFSIFYALIDYQVVAARGREFFSVMWILFVVQSTGCVDKVKIAIYIFVASSMSLAIYQYLFSDFFSS